MLGEAEAHTGGAGLGWAGRGYIFEGGAALVGRSPGRKKKKEKTTTHQGRASGRNLALSIPDNVPPPSLLLKKTHRLCWAPE
jgi:hypothetical protein